MSKPIAVLTSDIHFNINNLYLASAALQAAKDKAEELRVPLVIAGDLNDTKAIIRAEVANEIIRILKDSKVKIYVMVGNHDLINEKSTEHGLNYLRPYAQIVDTYLDDGYLKFIPYQTNHLLLKDILSKISPGSTVIMHQGFLGANLGDYVQDKTSIDPCLVGQLIVISGHYHRHQTLYSTSVPHRGNERLGTVTYIGSPYTMSYGEANDGPKGFLILNSDGTFTREILNLRKHIIVSRTTNNVYDSIQDYNLNDLLLLKVEGPLSELQKLNKNDLGDKLIGHTNFKLDLIANETKTYRTPEKSLTIDAIFDSIIDNTTDSDAHKTDLKALWRDLL